LMYYLGLSRSVTSCILNSCSPSNTVFVHVYISNLVAISFQIQGLQRCKYIFSSIPYERNNNTKLHTCCSANYTISVAGNSCLDFPRLPFLFLCSRLKPCSENALDTDKADGMITIKAKIWPNPHLFPSI